MGTDARPALIVLDAMSLIHRAYHAVPRHFATADGEPTNAVYGFMNILLRVVDDLAPGHAAAAFDLPGPTFRDELYPAYKAHRDAPDAALAAQFGRVRQLVETLGIPIYEAETYEADDVLGTLARQAEAAGFDVWLVTGDRDALQLVTPHVRVLSSNPRTGQPIVYDEQAIVDRWGVAASQVVDFKGLQGDSSDNIPGVKGVGEKTAAQLLTTFADIEDIYAHLDDERIRPAVRRRLDGQAEIARLSRRLAAIDCEAPVRFDPERTRLWQPDEAALRALLHELQFRTMDERLPFLSAPAAAPAGAAAAAAPRTPEVAPTVVTSAAAAGALLERLAAADRAAVVPYVRRSAAGRELLGMALADADAAAYVPMPDGAAAFEALRPWLDDDERAKVVFDSKELSQALAACGAGLRGVDVDLFLAAYVSSPNAVPGSLDDLVYRRRGLELDAQLPTPPPAGGLERPDPHQAAHPACLRAALALELADELDAEVEELEVGSLLRDVEMPLALVLGDMERRGIALDGAALRDLSLAMEREIAEIEAAIYADVGHEFNVNSPKQLGGVLFEELGLPAGRKTKSGYSTASGVLDQLMDAHPVVRRVLDYRELTKLRSTYVAALPAMVDPSTGRLHTTFNQAGAATGRLSSANPNLQNIPIRTPRGREIRRAFVAADADWSLLAIDYSQIDLRVLAHMSQDAAMCQAFADGHDIHAATAARLHDVPMDQVTDEMRRLAKTTNFGIVYGISAQGLSSRTELSRREADQFIKNYFDTYPGVQTYMEATIAEARARGFVETLFKRRRYLPEVNARAFHQRSAAERMAINMPIQGTTADIMKIAMVDVERRIRAQGFQGRMLLQVHDDLLFEVPNAELDDFAGFVRGLMTDAVRLRVPLVVDAKAGPNWRDMDAI